LGKEQNSSTNAESTTTLTVEDRENVSL